jgi:hypothetical protein
MCAFLAPEIETENRLVQNETEDRGVQPCAPWENDPYPLTNWWSMEKFSADEFVSIAGQLTMLKHEAEHDLNQGSEIAIGPEVKKVFLVALGRIKSKCEKIGLKVSAKAAQLVIDLLNQPGTTFSSLAGPFDHVVSNIQWEMEEVLFFHMPSKQAEFYAQRELFGVEVNAKFPSIQFDMIEAGNCYAMGRGTACVFHLMRIMEVGVQKFGDKLDVTLASEKNWQNILDEVNKAIKALPPRASGAVEMSQAAANFGAFEN